MSEATHFSARRQLCGCLQCFDALRRVQEAEFCSRACHVMFPARNVWLVYACHGHRTVQLLLDDSHVVGHYGLWGTCFLSCTCLDFQCRSPGAGRVKATSQSNVQPASSQIA